MTNLVSILCDLYFARVLSDTYTNVLCDTYTNVLSDTYTNVLCDTFTNVLCDLYFTSVFILTVLLESYVHYKYRKVLLL